VTTVPPHRGQANPSHYWRGQVAPRRDRLLRDGYAAWALGLALVGTVAVWSLPVRSVPIATVAGAALAYAALSFGACVTGAVLALTIGSPIQRHTWATTAPPGTHFSHYSELVFVFTWAALAQLGVVVAAFLGFILGGDTPIAPSSPLISHVLLTFPALTVGIYAVLEIITVVSTISQLGVVSDADARNDLPHQPAHVPDSEN